MRPACWVTWVACLKEDCRRKVFGVLLPAAVPQLAYRRSWMRPLGPFGPLKSIVNVYRYWRVIFAVRVECFAREHTFRVWECLSVERCVWKTRTRCEPAANLWTPIYHAREVAGRMTTYVNDQQM